LGCEGCSAGAQADMKSQADTVAIAKTENTPTRRTFMLISPQWAVALRKARGIRRLFLLAFARPVMPGGRRQPGDHGIS
ncbi:MAG: hypothetical protein JW888_16195, partial [Pirellulales bacterium]|nr:hypothetical protein [Pirellulales bacterium]